MFLAVGAFAENDFLKLALQRNVAARDDRLPISYVVFTVELVEHAGGVTRRTHERMENGCKETTNTETIRCILEAFEEHCRLIDSEHEA